MSGNEKTISAFEKKRKRSAVTLIQERSVRKSRYRKVGVRRNRGGAQIESAVEVSVVNKAKRGVAIKTRGGKRKEESYWQNPASDDILVAVRSD